MPSSLSKKLQPARYGVANGAEMLTYCRVRSAFAAVSALSRTRLRLFQQAAGSLRAFLLACLLVSLGAVGAAAAELADPTRPTRTLPATPGSPQAAAALRVSAIFISGERRIAVVNGRSVRVGETIGGATVRRIERDRVSFLRGGRTFSVTLLSASARQ